MVYWDYLVHIFGILRLFKTQLKAHCKRQSFMKWMLNDVWFVLIFTDFAWYPVFLVGIYRICLISHIFRWYLQVLLDILVELGWSHVAVVVDDNLDSTDRKMELLKTASRRNICISRIIEMSSDTADMSVILSELVKVESLGMFCILVASINTHVGPLTSNC